MAVLRVSLVTIAALVLLTSCGTDDSSTADSPTTTTTSQEPGTDPALPDCTEVWVEGADLPGDYEGCQGEDGPVEPEIVECSSGQRLVLHDDAFWAVRGHVIKHAPEGLTTSKAYADTLYSCRA